MMPSAPAGGSVTSPGSWYRQLNSKKSEASRTATALAMVSRQASAVARRSALARRRSSPAQPASPATVASRNSGPGVYPPVSW